MAFHNLHYPFLAVQVVAGPTIPRPLFGWQAHSQGVPGIFAGSSRPSEGAYL